MKRLSALIICILLAGAFLSGCLNAASVEQYGYVVLIGVDKGKERQYYVTFMLQQEEAGSSDSQAGNGGANYLGVEADNIFDAVRALFPAVPFELNLSRANLIVVSEEIASSGAMQDFMDFSWSSLRLRQSCKLVVTMGSAEDFIKGLESDSKPNITKLQYSLMQNYTAEGMTVACNYALFNQGIVSGCFDSPVTLGRVDKSAPEDSIPTNDEYSTMGVERKGGMAAYTSGCALFDGWRMSGVLNERDSLMLLLATGKFENGHITVPVKDGLLVIALKEADMPKVQFELSPNPHASVKITVKCEMQKDTTGRAKSEWESGVRESVEGFIQAELERMFYECRDMGSDALGFGRYAVKECLSSGEWEELEWKAVYPEMTAQFSVSALMNDEKLENYKE